MGGGVLITLEGGEGAGKSTQARRLGDRIAAVGRAVVVTREPGGSPGAEQIRRLVVTGAPDAWSPIAETLLIYAARRDHLDRTIRPALHSGAVVICDRFLDSTRAYQGGPQGAPASLLSALEETVLEGLRPDLTLILDLPEETGLARAAARGAGEGRFEAKDLAFHRRLRQAFRDIAAREAQRCVLIDASLGPEEVAADIWRAANSRLALGCTARP